MRNLIALGVLACLMAMAAHGAADTANVRVFKIRGSIQCEPNTGVSPDTMRKELENAGIPVKSLACGRDGRMYPAVCGGGDGAINIFEIPMNFLTQAESLGFRNLSGLPDAREIPCQ